MVIDPVTGGVIAVLAIAAIIFAYFARQSDDDSNFDKMAGETTRLLLSDKDKKSAVKPKSTRNKFKSEKKPEKKENDSVQSSHNVEEPPRAPEQPEEIAVVDSSDKENISEAEANVDQVLPTGPTPPEPLVEDEPKSTKSKKSKRAHATAKEKSEKSPLPLASSVNHEIQIIEEVLVKRNAPVEETESPASPKKVAKKKKRGPVQGDLDHHKVLGRLATIEEIEPEYISFLTQFFNDSSDREIALVSDLSILEKSVLELRQKAEQHCAARMSAEREAKEHQRAAGELSKRVSQLEKDVESGKAMVAVFKEKASESAANSVANATAELSAELERVKLSEKASVKAAQQLATQAQDWQAKADILSREMNTLRSSVEEGKKAKADLVETRASLEHNQKELQALTKDFAELEVLSRDLKTRLDAKKLEVHVAAAPDNDNEVSSLSLELENVRDQLRAKEAAWNEKESGYMIEQQKLAALVDTLNNEIAKFSQFKSEYEELKARFAETEKELELRKKQLADQEIVVSNEDGLKAENAVLKQEIESLKKQVEDLKSSHQKEISSLEKKASPPLENGSAVDASDEVVVLKKAVNLSAAPSSSVEVEKLREENQYLQQKNEELRHRNFKILDDVTALEKRVSAGSSGGAVDNNKQKTVDHSKELVDERSLVATALSSIGNIPDLPAGGADKKKYSSWLKNVSADIKRRLEDRESVVSATTPSVSTPDENSANYRAALETLSTELVRIEKAWDQQSNKYEKTIADLSKKLDKTQISDLRQSLSATSTPANSPAVEASTPSNGALLSNCAQPENTVVEARRKESEDEWEVVN